MTPGTRRCETPRSFFVLGRFGGLSRESGPTDHPSAKSPVKQKFGGNNGNVRAMVVRCFRTTKDDYLMAGNKTLKNYKNIFGN